MRLFRILFQCGLIIFFTLLTQIGGVLYAISFAGFRQSKIKRWLCFIGLYVLCTFFVLPYLAPLFGREKIATNDQIKVHSFFTLLCNRNYVVPEMNAVLSNTLNTIAKKHPSLEIHCLDANFPFWNGFPLLPHLSHVDGKKLDISLVYMDAEGIPTNNKPTRSGYGAFVEPKPNEYNQIEVCKAKGYWQYDFPKYLTFGTIHQDLIFGKEGTRELLTAILQQSAVSKVFIEPHLRTRLNVQHAKLRYHGCRAVRHDDHIHLQVK
ncbi:MAG: hypothetical protein ACI828_000295 [Flavobacteriales bacterium]|jgi:hypothetical protein